MKYILSVWNNVLMWDVGLVLHRNWSGGWCHSLYSRCQKLGKIPAWDSTGQWVRKESQGQFWTTSIYITWELVRSTGSQIPLQTSWVRIYTFTRFLGTLKFDKCYLSESWDFHVRGWSWCWKSESSDFRITQRLGIQKQVQITIENCQE